MNDVPKDQVRKPYESPKLIVIGLRPEEAVLGNCKTASGGAGPGPTCTSVGNCRGIGS